MTDLMMQIYNNIRNKYDLLSSEKLLNKWTMISIFNNIPNDLEIII